MKTPRNPRLLPDPAFAPGEECFLVFPHEKPRMGIIRTVQWQTNGLSYEVLWPDMELTFHLANELCREGRVDYGVSTEEED